MKIGLPRETAAGERRVALTPMAVRALTAAEHVVLIERGAGLAAGYDDDAYAEAGGRVLDRSDAGTGTAAAEADCLVQVRLPSADRSAGEAELSQVRSGQTLIGLAEPLNDLAPLQSLAATGATVFALELMPRITRAQAMDVLSSQANIAGYKAVLLAAGELPRLFPMMMTAAGTITPARVLVLGAGVAGLQAIATARRLGARVTAYDIRPAVREQVESLGASFLALSVAADGAEAAGGYAKAMDEAFYRRQREMLADAVVDSDVVITTAAVPGRRAPVLITADAVQRMRRGCVIVDLAAERGGNCELTDGERTVTEGGVLILGPANLPATVAYHASQTFARNVTAFIEHLTRDGELTIDIDDEITAATLLARGGSIVQPRVREHFGLDPEPAESTSHG